MMRLRTASLLLAFSCSPRLRRPTRSARGCCGGRRIPTTLRIAQLMPTSQAGKWIREKHIHGTSWVHIRPT